MSKPEANANQVEQARQEFERATAALREAQADAERALAQLTALEGEDGPPSGASRQAGVRPAAARPGNNVARARAVATELAMVGAPREDARRRLVRLFESMGSAEMEALLDDVFAPPRQQRRGPWLPGRRNRRVTDAF